MTQSERFNHFAGTESVRQNLRTKSLHGAFSTAAGAGLDFALRLVSTAVLARLVAPEQWGLIGMVTALTAIAEQFRDLGLSAATIQGKNISHEQVTTLFWVNVFAGVLITVVICAASPAISAFYGDPRLTLLTIAIASNFFWGGLSVQHQALLVRQMKLPQKAILNLSANVLSVALAIVLAMNHYGYWALAWREIARSILNCVGVWALCPWVPGLPGRGANAGSLLRFGRDITLTNLLDAVTANLDQLLIGKFCGPTSLGLYRQGCQLILTPVDYLCTPIRSVALPALSALQPEPDRYRRYYERIVFFLSVVTLPLGLFGAIYAREITLLVLGPRWIDAAVFLRIFALAAVIRPALGTSQLVPITSGRSKTYFFIVLMHSVTLILLMFVTVRWGAEGIAMAQLGKSMILALPTLYYSFRHTSASVSGFFLAMAHPLKASLVMVIALILLRTVLPIEAVFTSIVLGGAIAGGSYFCAWMVLPGGKAELIRLLTELGGGLNLADLRRKRSEVVASSAS
jgi:O-antigen/teichoic acid export membrane protein